MIKNSVLILTVCLISLSCSREPSPNASNSAPPPTKSPVASNSPSPAVPGEKTGEKVENLTEVDFSDGIPDGWQKLDPGAETPSGFEISGGVFKLTIPTGKDLYGENRTAPRLVKNVTGDFEFETRVKFSPKSDYQGAGLLIFRNDNNYLRLERGFGGVGGGESGIRFDRAEDENYDGVATPASFPTAAPVVELKLRREGKIVTAMWREVGKESWVEVGKVSNTYPETVTIGLMGTNTGDRVTAEFSNVRLRPLKK